MKKSTKILIGVALLCTLAIGTTWVLHNSDNRLASETTPNQTNVVEQKAADGTPAQAVKPTNQFDIPELGIKMTIPEGLSGLQYIINSDGFDGHKYASIGTKSMSELDGVNSKCSYAVGSVHMWDKDISNETIMSKKIGDHYYSFVATQGACSNNQVILSMQISQGKLLKEAFDTTSMLER